ncbi:hypothetical protein ABVT39_019619 [Epinephelus coioides]
MNDSRRKSAVWTQFNLISATAASCTLCKAKLSTKGGSTANLHRHLRTKHPTVQLLQVRDEPQPEPAPTASSTSTAPAASGTSTVSTAPTSSSSTITGPAPATVATRRATGRPRARGGTQARLTHFVSRPIDPLRQRAFDEMLARMVAKDFQPYSIVENTGFRQFTKELNP